MWLKSFHDLCSSWMLKGRKSEWWASSVVGIEFQRVGAATSKAGPGPGPLVALSLLRGMASCPLEEDRSMDLEGV